jgi:hypothetical protein
MSTFLSLTFYLYVSIKIRFFDRRSFNSIKFPIKKKKKRM